MAAYGWALAFSGSVDVGYPQGLTSFSEGLVGPSSCCGYPGVLVQPLLPKAMNTRWIELCSVSTGIFVSGVCTAVHLESLLLGFLQPLLKQVRDLFSAPSASVWVLSPLIALVCYLTVPYLGLLPRTTGLTAPICHLSSHSLVP